MVSSSHFGCRAHNVGRRCVSRHVSATPGQKESHCVLNKVCGACGSSNFEGASSTWILPAFPWSTGDSCRSRLWHPRGSALIRPLAECFPHFRVIHLNKLYRL